MAIEPLKKIVILTHGSLEEEVVEVLTRTGTVHVESFDESDEVEPRGLPPGKEKEIRELTLRMSQVEFLLSFLKEHAQEKPGFVQGFIKPKHYLSVDEFLQAERRVDLSKVYAECQEYDRRLIALRDETARLEQESAELENWKELEIPIDEIKGGLVFGLKTVRVQSRDLAAIEEELEAGVPESALLVASENGPATNCVVLFGPDAEEDVAAVLSRFQVDDVVLPDTPLEPLERIEQISRELAALGRRHEDILSQLEGYLKHVPALEVLKEYHANRRAMAEITASFGATAETVAIFGWVPERSVRLTLERLDAVSPDMSIELEEPEDGDNPPVSLSNPRWAKPFEMIVKLYGTPNRSERDPTVIVALSFSLFFGFCIGDVGYGLVIITAFLLMRRYLPLGPGVKNLLLVMVYGGAFAIVVGALTGSWFGIEITKLPGFIQSMAVFDPLLEPIPVMVLCMVMGFIHMMSGTVIEFIDSWRSGNRTGALIDQGLSFLFFICLGVAVPLALTKVLPGGIAVLVALAPLVAMLLLLGREAKSLGGKAASGLYETYNTVVGWIGDTISYLRLYALGLATFVIGWVVNTLAGMVGGIAPVIGILAMIVLLLVGHTFNVTINLLGAFVHPLRLEFVEFFGKFYEDGAREFAPLRYESKIVLMEKEGGR